MAKVASKNAGSDLTSEALFAACDHSRDLFLLVQEGRIVRGNRAWKSFVGADDGAVGCTLCEFVVADDQAALADIEQGEPRQVDVSISPRTDVRLPGILHTQPLPGGQALIVLRDLGEAY